MRIWDAFVRLPGPGAPDGRSAKTSTLRQGFPPRLELRTYLLASALTWPMELETRKVQKLGYSSLGVSLPKDWAASNGIRPGALVSLAIEDDGSLRVRVGPLEEYPVSA